MELLIYGGCGRNDPAGPSLQHPRHPDKNSGGVTYPHHPMQSQHNSDSEQIAL